MQATVERGDSGAVPSAEEASREEADARSVYVGNVDYGCTPEELQQHFQVGSKSEMVRIVCLEASWQLKVDSFFWASF